uniref:DDE-1 domain-containing protein n=1 Tax=Amphimedon queenslandica TaxID=400682 RepID=A0A1X7VHH4_AMPQE
MRMMATQFTDWFYQNLVPHVTEQLQLIGEALKLALIVDNCSAHPDTKDLVSEDGKIFPKFVPLKITALIEAMDQGVTQSFKKPYKKL